MSKFAEIYNNETILVKNIVRLYRTFKDKESFAVLTTRAIYFYNDKGMFLRQCRATKEIPVKDYDFCLDKKEIVICKTSKQREETVMFNQREIARAWFERIAMIKSDALNESVLARIVLSNANSANTSRVSSNNVSRVNSREKSSRSENMHVRDPKQSIDKSQSLSQVDVQLGVQNLSSLNERQLIPKVVRDSLEEDEQQDIRSESIGANKCRVPSNDNEGDMDGFIATFKNQPRELSICHQQNSSFNPKESFLVYNADSLEISPRVSPSKTAGLSLNRGIQTINSPTDEGNSETRAKKRLANRKKPRNYRTNVNLTLNIGCLTKDTRTVADVESGQEGDSPVDLSELRNSIDGGNSHCSDLETVTDRQVESAIHYLDMARRTKRHDSTLKSQRFEFPCRSRSDNGKLNKRVTLTSNFHRKHSTKETPTPSFSKNITKENIDYTFPRAKSKHLSKQARFSFGQSKEEKTLSDIASIVDSYKKSHSGRRECSSNRIVEELKDKLLSYYSKVYLVVATKSRATFTHFSEFYLGFLNKHLGSLQTSQFIEVFCTVLSDLPSLIKSAVSSIDEEVFIDHRGLEVDHRGGALSAKEVRLIINDLFYLKVASEAIFERVAGESRQGGSKVRSEVFLLKSRIEDFKENLYLIDFYLRRFEEKLLAN